MVDGKKSNLFKDVQIRCYAELNDFLPYEWRYRTFTHSIKTPITVGEAIETLGIPFSEVDLILVNNNPVSRGQRVYEKDRISLYPAFETLDISSLKDENHPPLRETRFILDAHLGKLAKYLRMLGFDTLFRNDFEDPEIIDIAEREKRIILTRDKDLLGSKRVSHGYYVRSTEKHQQLREIVQKFDLYSQFRSFSRCMTCNAELIKKDKEDILDKVPQEVGRIFDEFFYCPSCGKVFWKGSHFKRMEQAIRDLTV